MFNSFIRNKVSTDLRTKLITEDTKTSSVFETLFLLPDEKIFQILKGSIKDSKEAEEIFKDVNVNSMEYEFWPRWKTAGECQNDRFVEPDVFISFDKIDIIIEAKIDDGNEQNSDQWKNEIKSYNNEYKDKKKVILIAINGNKNIEPEKIDEVYIFKSSWNDIYESFSKVVNEMNDKIVKNIYNQFENVCKVFNINKVEWLSDIDTDEIRKAYNLISSVEKTFIGIVDYIFKQVGINGTFKGEQILGSPTNNQAMDRGTWGEDFIPGYQFCYYNDSLCIIKIVDSSRRQVGNSVIADSNNDAETFIILARNISRDPFPDDFKDFFYNEAVEFKSKDPAETYAKKYSFSCLKSEEEVNKMIEDFKVSCENNGIKF